MPRSSRALTLTAVFAVAIAGCKSLEEGAVDQFSKEFSCPRDRVSVVERKDLKAYDLLFGAPAEPAADVKADPERYALWQKQQADTAEGFNRTLQVFDAKGCDHEQRYTCSHPRDEEGTNASVVACSPVTPRPSPQAK